MSVSKNESRWLTFLQSTCHEHLAQNLLANQKMSYRSWLAIRSPTHILTEGWYYIPVSKARFLRDNSGVNAKFDPSKVFRLFTTYMFKVTKARIQFVRIWLKLHFQSYFLAEQSLYATISPISFRNISMLNVNELS